VHPFLVNLYFTFQTQDKLCFVMGTFFRIAALMACVSDVDRLCQWW
jgi:hypothetical protein